MKWTPLLMALTLSACQTPTALAPQLTALISPRSYRAGNRSEELIDQRNADIERGPNEEFPAGMLCTRRGDWCVLSPFAEDIHLRLPTGSWMTHPAFDEQAQAYPFLVRLHESDHVLIGLTFEREQNEPQRRTQSFELALYDTSPSGERTEVARMLLVSWIDDSRVQHELRSDLSFSDSRAATPVLTVQTTASRLENGVRTADPACSYTRTLTRSTTGLYEFDAPAANCPDYLPQ